MQQQQQQGTAGSFMAEGEAGPVILEGEEGVLLSTKRADAVQPCVAVVAPLVVFIQTRLSSLIDHLLQAVRR